MCPERLSSPLHPTGRCLPHSSWDKACRCWGWSHIWCDQTDKCLLWPRWRPPHSAGLLTICPCLDLEMCPLETFGQQSLEQKRDHHQAPTHEIMSSIMPASIVSLSPPGTFPLLVAKWCQPDCPCSIGLLGMSPSWWALLWWWGQRWPSPLDQPQTHNWPEYHDSIIH